MSKILLVFLFSLYCYGDVVTFLPYGGAIAYEKNEDKSLKEQTYLTGLYASVGNLGYLLEVGYNYLQTKYKDTAADDLKQHDFIFAYSKYGINSFYRLGVHYIDTTDAELGNGIVAIATLGKYSFINYDKFSYGMEGYLSYYKDGHTQNDEYIDVIVGQLTPYIGYFKSLSVNWQNDFDLRANAVALRQTGVRSFYSFEISDTLYYKSFYTSIKAYYGKMQVGVKDSGFTVYNTFDTLKEGYGVKFGYYFKKSLSISLSLNVDRCLEYRKTEDGSRYSGIASLSYNF